MDGVSEADASCCHARQGNDLAIVDLPRQARVAGLPGVPDLHEGVRLGRPSALPAEIVARIVAERESGSSLRVIADGLNRDGIATAQGGRAWHASTVRKVLTSQQAPGGRMGQ